MNNNNIGLIEELHNYHIPSALYGELFNEWIKNSEDEVIRNLNPEKIEYNKYGAYYYNDIISPSSFCNKVSNETQNNISILKEDLNSISESKEEEYKDCLNFIKANSVDISSINSFEIELGKHLNNKISQMTYHIISSNENNHKNNKK